MTVVADAGMISKANQRDIENAGLSFILGMRIPDVPYVVAQWCQKHPGTAIADGQIFTQHWPAGPTDQRRDQIIYQYKADRARRTLRGIEEQVAKAEKAVAGKVPVKRNRFIQLAGATKTINRDLEAKARAIAGRSSSAPLAATAPSKSRPATTQSPPPTPYQTIFTRHSTPSTATTVRANLIKVRFFDAMIRSIETHR